MARLIEKPEPKVEEMFTVEFSESELAFLLRAIGGTSTPATEKMGLSCKSAKGLEDFYLSCPGRLKVLAGKYNVTLKQRR